ncbi:cache domain-containing sensor histidine kinase [Paenibacillus macquariensis]|nr:sensor histidine kinase [Paenibacillus macquariensis]MEC0093891.1 sensor histidine kinase [Paenibacillus macquariensis]OAB33048.1 C50 carotenoid epsilon cyclase [Paenibacillus macquariensis subsp. macquariensis]
MKFFSRLPSIQTNMVLSSVSLILMTIIIMSVTSYYLTKDSVKSTAETYTTELVKQVNNNIKSYINGMKSMSDLVAGNYAVQDFLSSNTFNSLQEERDYKEKISDMLGAMLVSRTDISSANIFGYQGQFVSGRKELELNPFVDITSMNWYMNAQNNDGNSVISPSHVQPIFKDRYPWVVSLSRELVSKDGNKKLGIFLVDLNFSVMNDMFKDIRLGQRGYLFIIDSDGKIVYHPQQQLIYSNLKSEVIDKVLEVRNGTFISGQGSNSRMYTVQDSEFGWKIVGVSYVNELVDNQNEVLLSIVFLGTICIIIAIIISLFLSQRVTQPIKRLQGYMKEVENGNFDIHVPVSKTIEIQRFARAFNMMVGKIKELMTQTVSDQEQKRKSEISALQAQINPHFLYNTLDSIVWMAESNKSREVVLMTSALAKLFRSSISKNDELVAIRTEIEHITNYLMIQKMRYKNKLDYHIEISELVLEYRIIKIIMQPLIENAIYHGIKMKQGPGFIRIASEETQTDIIVIIEDNGNGMDEEKLKSLLLSTAVMESGRGIGVRNVHERLKLYYGERYGLTYHSVLGVGTTVYIRIPKSR